MWSIPSDYEKSSHQPECAHHNLCPTDPVQSAGHIPVIDTHGVSPLSNSPRPSLKGLVTYMPVVDLSFTLLINHCLHSTTTQFTYQQTVQQE